MLWEPLSPRAYPLEEETVTESGTSATGAATVSVIVWLGGVIVVAEYMVENTSHRQEAGYISVVSRAGSIGKLTPG